MKRILSVIALFLGLALFAVSAQATVYSDTDFSSMGYYNGAYVAGSPGYAALAYTGNDDAVVGVKGPLGTLSTLNMSFTYSNPIGTGSAPFAAFGVSENSLWDKSAQEFQIIAMSGTQINDSTLVHVFNTTTNANYIPMDQAITLGQLLGLNYNGFAFGDMNVLRAYAYIGDTGGVSSGSVDINSITVNTVPLPPSVLLLGSGILGMVGLGWRRRQAKSAAA